METSLDQSGTQGPHPMEGTGLDRAQWQAESLGNL
jgi:hypothetical protein